MSDNLGELNKRLRIMTDSINSNLCCLKDIIEKEFGEVEEILLHPFGETCDKPSYVKLCDLETLLDKLESLKVQINGDDIEINMNLDDVERELLDLQEQLKQVDTNHFIVDNEWEIVVNDVCDKIDDTTIISVKQLLFYKNAVLEKTEYLSLDGQPYIPQGTIIACAVDTNVDFTPLLTELQLLRSQLQQTDTNHIIVDNNYNLVEVDVCDGYNVCINTTENITVQTLPTTLIIEDIITDDTREIVITSDDSAFIEEVTNLLTNNNNFLLKGHIDYYLILPQNSYSDFSVLSPTSIKVKIVNELEEIICGDTVIPIFLNTYLNPAETIVSSGFISLVYEKRIEKVKKLIFFKNGIEEKVEYLDKLGNTYTLRGTPELCKETTTTFNINSVLLNNESKTYTFEAGIYKDISIQIMSGTGVIDTGNSITVPAGYSTNFSTDTVINNAITVSANDDSEVIIFYTIPFNL